MTASSRGIDASSRVFVTGGAGFIGSHLIDTLALTSCSLTVYDNLSSGKRTWLEPHLASSQFTFIQADLLDYGSLKRALEGHDIVWHLGANGDIPGGYDDTALDLEQSIIATRNVLEAMKETGARDILFSSSGAVYGDIEQVPTPETVGPLLPVSLYGAGKVAAENLISAFCHLFGLRGWIFRFGNVVGGRMCRGAIYDFIRKLQASPDVLEILGDGTQKKNYFLVEECIEGMLYAYTHLALNEEKPCEIINLGADESTGLMTIVNAVCQEMGCPDIEKQFAGSARGWPGDQPRVQLDVGKINALGWRARHTSDEAIVTAAKRMADYLGRDRPLNASTTRKTSVTFTSSGLSSPLDICVIGMWHLGTVLATSLAEWGHRVTGTDPNPEVIARLKQGHAPLFEPGLDDLICKNLSAKRLRFCEDLERAVGEASCVWLGFDTPVNEQDEADLTILWETIDQMASALSPKAVVVVSSQVPVGTCEAFWQAIQERNPSIRGGIVYVPENLRLGSAIERFQNPDMVVIGSDCATSAQQVQGLFEPVKRSTHLLPLRTAEMVKHAINAFLATSISLANELGDLCEEIGADGVEVARLMRLDQRISPKAPLIPGLGFAGGTLARDLRGLQRLASKHDYVPYLLHAVLDVNASRNEKLVDRLMQFLDIEGSSITLWGLTYTAQTSTLRRSASLDILQRLLDLGATLRAYDPQADLGERSLLSGVTFCEDPYASVEGCEALVVVTPWPEFQDLDYARIYHQMKRPLLFDTPHYLSPSELSALGFEYISLGQGVLSSTLHKEHPS